MKLRTQIALSLVLVSLVSAASVGGIAYWMLMRDFKQSVLDDAFSRFRDDVAAYIDAYGSWQQAVQSEPFPRFVEYRNRPLPGMTEGPHSPLREDSHFQRRATAPFMFLLLDPQGVVMKPAEGYAIGQSAPELLDDAFPISLRGEVVAKAVPLGDPNLSPQDESYLRAMRQALLTGMSVAVLIALLLARMFMRRMSRGVGRLMVAVRQMRQQGKLQEPIPVRRNDEIGALSEAFNHMSADLAKAHDKLRELSIRDPLTQLYNRRHFVEQASQLFEQASRYDHPLTFLLADLDHFKRINDQFSHSVGDEVLRQVGQLFTKNLRKSDVIARYGGEEFVVAFAETSLAQAWQRCETLRLAIENHPWHEIHPELKVTLSGGLCGSLTLGSVKRMLHQADTNLYRAKKLGRNCIERSPQEVDSVA